MEAFNFTAVSLQDVILFLFPGFLAIFLFYFQIPDRKKSDLTIIILSVAASLGLTYLTRILFDLVSALVQQNVSETNVWFGVTRIVLSVILSIILAQFVKSRVFAYGNKKLFGVHLYPFGRLWNAFLNIDQHTVVKVLLSDGTNYIGRFSKASNDPDDAVQELELIDPFYFDKKKAKITRIEETKSVLIQGNAIISIEKITDAAAKKIYKFS